MEITALATHFIREGVMVIQPLFIRFVLGQTSENFMDTGSLALLHDLMKVSIIPIIRMRN